MAKRKRTNNGLQNITQKTKHVAQLGHIIMIPRQPSFAFIL